MIIHTTHKSLLVFLLIIIFIPDVYADDNIYIVDKNVLHINNDYKIVLNENILNHNVDNDYIYISTKNYFYGINKDDGVILYKIRIADTTKIDITQNYVYVSSGENVYKINKNTGEIINKYNIKNNDIFTYLNISTITNIYYNNSSCSNCYNFSDDSKINKSSDFVSDDFTLTSNDSMYLVGLNNIFLNTALSQFNINNGFYYGYNELSILYYLPAIEDIIVFRKPVRTKNIDMDGNNILNSPDLNTITSNININTANINNNTANINNNTANINNNTLNITNNTMNINTKVNKSGDSLSYISNLSHINSNDIIFNNSKIHMNNDYSYYHNDSGVQKFSNDYLFDYLFSNENDENIANLVSFQIISNASTGFNIFQGRRARGLINTSNKSAQLEPLQSGDITYRVTGTGWNGEAWAGTRGAIDFIATGNWNTTSMPMETNIYSSGISGASVKTVSVTDTQNLKIVVAGKGIQLTSPNGLSTACITLSNLGVLTTTPGVCT